MTDWSGAFTNSIWIVGLALLLADLSYASYRRQQTRPAYHPTWRESLAAIELICGRGVLLICLGMLVSNPVMPEGGLWALLGLVTGIKQWELRKLNLKRSTSDILTTNYRGGYPSQHSISPPRQNAGFLPKVQQAFGQTGIFLDRIQPLWSGALLVLFIFSEGRYLLYGWLALLVLWAWAALSTKTLLRPSPLNWNLYLWLALVPVTTWATTNRAITREYLGYFLAELVAFYTLSRWAKTIGRVRLASWGVVAVGAGLALLAPLLLQGGRFFSLIALTTRLGLASGETINRNVMAGVLVVVLPFSLGLLFSQRKGSYFKLRVSLALFANLLIGGSLILTQSRGAFLAGILALGLLLVVGIAKLRQRWWLWTGLAILILIVSAGLLVLFQASGKGEDWTTYLSSQLARSDSLEGLDARLEVWSRAVDTIRDFAFSGVGLGNLRVVTPLLHPYFLINTTQTSTIPHAHNVFLQVGVDLGLPGLINYLAFLICVTIAGVKGWQRWQMRKDREMAWLILGGLGSMVALVTHGLVDAVSWGTKPGWIAWAVLGLLLATSLQFEETSQSLSVPVQDIFESAPNNSNWVVNRK